MNENLKTTTTGRDMRALAVTKQRWTRPADVPWTSFLAAAFGALILGVVQPAAAESPLGCTDSAISVSLNPSPSGIVHHGDLVCYTACYGATGTPNPCDIASFDATLIFPNGSTRTIMTGALIAANDFFCCPSADPRCNPLLTGADYCYVVDHADEVFSFAGCPPVETAGTGRVVAYTEGNGESQTPGGDEVAPCATANNTIRHACCEPCSGICTEVQSAAQCPFPRVFTPDKNCDEVACSPLVCNDNSACTTDACNPATGTCVFTPNPPCNDNSACTTDSCDPDTGCVFTPITCNDNNACTTDSCNPFTGCVFTPITCNDNSACTLDSCNPATGCVFLPIPCNDNNACTTDTCNPLTGCAFTPIICNDNNVCTTETCNPFTGCVFSPITCSDGNPCTTDICNPLTGCSFTPIVCNDGNPCTDDTCDGAGGCVFTNNSNPCPDDGFICTSDVCSGGSCAHPIRSAGFICRQAQGICDVAEVCNGASRTCPSDGKCSAECRASADDCDPPEFCSGTSNSCPPDIVNTSCINADGCCPAGCNSGNDDDCFVISLDNRVDSSKKGSVLFYSKIELKWTPAPPPAPPNTFNLTQDTFLTIVNDYPEDVFVQWYFINGDPPSPFVFTGNPPIVVERGHPGWNWVDCTTQLTENESTFISAATGNPLGCQPFRILDPGTPPGRPDPNGPPGTRVLRGYAIAFAVDIEGHEISWNHLSGSADIVNYLNVSAWEYNAFVFQCKASSTPGQPCGSDNILDLDGSEYDAVYDKLLFDFYAVGSQAFTQGLNTVTLDTDLTLYPVDVDLRQDSDGPVTTKAHFDIWNQNEDGFSGTMRCITCWDQTLLSSYGALSNFMLSVLHTDKGKARIDGVQSDQCDSTESACSPVTGQPTIRSSRSRGAALLGVSDKILIFSGATTGRTDAGMNLVGQGSQLAAIKWDIVAPPDPFTTGVQVDLDPVPVDTETPADDAPRTLFGGQRNGKE